MFSASTLVGIAFIALSLYFLHRTLHTFRRAEQSSDWPRVTGKVLNSEAIAHSVSGNRRNFKVKYQYVVANQTYTSQRGAFYTLDGEEAKDLVAAHNQESRVSVYFDPKAPDQAVLVQGPRAHRKFGDVILASVGVLFSFLVLAGGLTGVLV